MQAAKVSFLRMALSVISAMLIPVLALADGGAIQVMQTVDGLKVTVFASPAIVTAGELDLSVLVQDPDSQATLTSADVEITVTPRLARYLAERHAATDKLATNRLLKVAHVELAEGWHDLAVTVSDGGRRVRVECDMYVARRPAKAASFWPWFTWPAVPLALVAANLTYRRWRTWESRRPDATHATKA